MVEESDYDLGDQMKKLGEIRVDIWEGHQIETGTARPHLSLLEIGGVDERLKKLSSCR